MNSFDHNLNLAFVSKFYVSLHFIKILVFLKLNVYETVKLPCEVEIDQFS